MARSPNTAASDVTSVAKETLDFDEDTLRAIAEVYKNEGNEAFRKGDLTNAIYFYTEGIKVNCKDEELKAKLYSNRATTQFCLENYTESLNDAKVATDLQPSFVKVITRGASACFQLHQYKEAITWCDKGLAIDKNNQKLLELRDRCFKEEDKLHDSGGGKAKGLFDTRTKATTDVSPRTMELVVCELLGDTHLRPGHFETAVDCYERCLSLARELGDRKAESRASRKLGVSYHHFGDFRKAIDYHKCDLSIAMETRNRSREGEACANLGSAYHNLGDVKTAIYYHGRHLEIVKELGDKLQQGVAYGNLGCDCLELGDYKAAIDHHEQDLKIAREVGHKKGEGVAYGNLGLAHFGLGDFRTAMSYFLPSLKIAREVGDELAEGRTYGNLGCAHYRLGELKTAINYHNRQLKIAKDTKDIVLEGKAYGNLANTHVKLGNQSIALKCFERQLKIAKQTGDKKAEGITNYNLGNNYRNLGNFKVALDYYEHQLQIAKDMGDRSQEGRAYGGLGDCYVGLQDFKAAKESHERQLKIAKEVGDRYAEGESFQSIASYYFMLGDLEKAIEFRERHIEISKELGESFGLARSFFELGRCFESQGRPQEALDRYQRSIATFDDMRNHLQFQDQWKISFRNIYQAAYTALWRLLLRQGKVVEALFHAEQGRAQALKDLMIINYQFQTTTSSEKGTAIGTMNEQLKCLPTNTVFIANEKQEIIFWVCRQGKDIELRRKHLGGEILHDDATSYLQRLIETACQEIDGRAAVNCEDRSLGNTENEGFVEERSPPNTEKQTQSLNLEEGALNKLYYSIIGPIIDICDGNELVFVPEGPLCLAPFAALMDLNSRYLCEVFRIRVIPSLSSLKLISDCPEGHHATTGALLVGDPWVQGVTKLEKLPFAREEVKMIAQILHTAPLIGRQATKEEVIRRLSSVALVHIAAHGRMETGEIALAPNSTAASPVEEDFILTMTDVLSVQMRAKLVVLSCCHSARGEIKAEGVVGIARAFLGAGARSVLVSLWAIDDEATLEFMRVFYQHLVNGKSASEALNQAMNSMRESDEFSEVKYWAPFVLIGDDITLEFGGQE